MNGSAVHLPILSNAHLEDKSNELIETIDPEPQDDTATTKTTIDTRPKLRSQYPTPTDLPDIVRNMTWHDPFYNNEKDAPHVIAVFDIDRTKYDQFNTYVILFFLILHATIISIYVGILASVYVLIPVAGVLFIRRRHQIHVAMTCCSIYIDEANSPWNHVNLKRKVIPYNDIDSCRVQVAYLTCMNTIVRNAVLSLKDSAVPEVVIQFVPEAQQFVNVVNVMKERSLSYSNNNKNDNSSNAIC